MWPSGAQQQTPEQTRPSGEADAWGMTVLLTLEEERKTFMPLNGLNNFLKQNATYERKNWQVVSI